MTSMLETIIYWSSIFGYCWIRFHPLIPYSSDTHQLKFYRTYILTYFGILFGILPGILADIYADILSYIYIEMCFLTSLYLALFLRFLSGICSDILSGILSDISSDILCDILHLHLRSRSATEIWLSQLRSGSAHWALALAAEVRQCPLTSGARGWGPAVSSRFRSGSAHWDLELAVVPTAIGSSLLRSSSAELWSSETLTCQVGKQLGTPKSIGEPPAVLLTWSFGGCRPFQTKP